MNLDMTLGDLLLGVKESNAGIAKMIAREEDGTPRYAVVVLNGEPTTSLILDAIQKVEDSLEKLVETSDAHADAAVRAHARWLLDRSRPLPPATKTKTRTISFTGTGRGMTELQECMFEGLVRFPLAEQGIFRHGSCRGSDVMAARLVRKMYGTRIKIIAHPGPEGDVSEEISGVDDETMPRKRHFERNRAMVDLCDELIATPFEESRQATGGVWYTISYAIKKNKEVCIISPSGKLGYEQELRSRNR